MSSAEYTENSLVERPALVLLEELGWQTAVGFDEKAKELGRDNQTEPVLSRRLKEAVQRLDPTLADDSVGKAIERITEDRSAMEPVRANREIYELLRDGAKIDVINAQGQTKTRMIQFVDWRVPDNNEWLAVSQFWLVDDMYTRRTDVVLFVNGIPLVLCEFKAPSHSVKEAYEDNLRGLPQRHPASVLVQRIRDSLERLGHRDGIDLRAVGLLQSVEEDR